MSYEPVRGTVPFRVIEHLKTLPPGEWISTAVLGHALDVLPQGLPTTLATAVRHGAIRREKRRDGVPGWQWQIGDGTPPPTDDDSDKPLRTTAPAPKPDPAMASPFTMAAAMDPAPAPKQPWPDPQTYTVTTPPASQSKPTARFGMFSDGTMTIGKGDDRIHLNPEEADELQDFVATRVRA